MVAGALARTAGKNSAVCSSGHKCPYACYAAGVAEAPTDTHAHPKAGRRRALPRPGRGVPGLTGEEQTKSRHTARDLHGIVGRVAAGGGATSRRCASAADRRTLRTGFEGCFQAHTQLRAILERPSGRGEIDVGGRVGNASGSTTLPGHTIRSWSPLRDIGEQAVTEPRSADASGRDFAGALAMWWLRRCDTDRRV
jgi:hypothetical protein